MSMALEACLPLREGRSPATGEVTLAFKRQVAWGEQSGEGC
jgi:hypothetical protein